MMDIRQKNNFESDQKKWSDFLILTKVIRFIEQKMLKIIENRTNWT